LTDEDISLACEKIEDNILTRALDGVIEEVEYYMDAAYSLEPDVRDAIYDDCLAIYLNDKTLKELVVDEHTVNNMGPAIVDDSLAETFNGLYENSMSSGSVNFENSRADSMRDLDEILKVQKFGERPSLEELEEQDSFWDESLNVVRQKLYIGDPGTIALSNVLENNYYLRSLRINCMNIGDAGATDLARALCKNDTLTALELPNNKICDGGATKLAAMLVVNNSIVLLDLKQNFIGDVGTRKLMLALRKNESVERRNIKLQRNRVKVANCFKNRSIDIKLGYSDIKAKRIPKHLYKTTYLKN